ncbi:DUF2461 domain-containing protein [Cryptosporangium aurantiacum]|uniref:TIGR02453 family protein n=1 Tax=Cryptosporangium aurantiacum TaxID=134849 RepID=A0A1M7J2U0_9ACTN|nr:DUF2461 domain-containing protein [Cryptosporangium aurantiacum]SHM47295.1 TIGR02453 family protein [Cryptosporangium aurantiacum]
MSRFEGFDAQVPEWFVGLEADNSKTYFDAHRPYYERAVRGQLTALLADLSEELGGETKIFRQNRDVRFSVDKSPYKTQTYGILSGSTLTPAGLYVGISADGLTAGGGYWRMERDQLERYRSAVADDERGADLAARTAEVEAAGLEQWGESLATAPRGYPRDHPRIEMLRRKSVTFGRRLPVGDGIGATEGRTFVAGTWTSSAPVLHWLDTHVGPTTAPPRRR